MNCPSCNSEDFYVGDFSGENCANTECKYFKGGSISGVAQSEPASQNEEVTFDLDWSEDEDKTPVLVPKKGMIYTPPADPNSHNFTQEIVSVQPMAAPSGILYIHHLV